MLDIELLRSWFLQKKRPFPWRDAKSPYSVLVSEVMLQQTQASRVLLYYERWMQRFPSIEALAAAPLDHVYKEWEGLGYYSRARSLHAMAQEICRSYGGKVPDEATQLRSIKGLGPYTVNALLAFAFHKNVAALDANVVRVVARLFAIQEDVTKQKTKNQLQQLADSLIPQTRGYEIAEALIELGAIVCKPKNPACASCPLQGGCRSFHKNLVGEIPISTKTNQYERLFRDVIILLSGQNILIKRQSEGQIMAGLYEFPYFESLPGGLTSEVAQRRIEEAFCVDARFEKAFLEVSQSFTRYRAILYPKVFSCLKTEVPGYEWHQLANSVALPFSSGHKKILQLLVTQF